MVKKTYNDILIFLENHLKEMFEYLKEDIAPEVRNHWLQWVIKNIDEEI